MKVYGPYLRKDGRKHVILYDGYFKKTVSYPRYLMQLHLGRELEEDETVDHKDNDFTNDSIDNLQILTLVDNIKKSAKSELMIELTCGVCNKKYTTKLRYHKHNWKKNITGKTACSRTCSGKLGK